MSRRTLVLLFLAFALFYFSALGTMPLLEPDEGRYAEIPREMLATGDFVTPHLNGVVYLEKPPLFYWGNAFSMAVFGENEFAARFFTAAVSVAGILLTYWMGAELAGWRTGLFSSVVLSTSLYYYAIGRLNTLDMTLALALLLAVFPAYLYLSGRRESRRYLHFSYAAAGFAFLAKGLVGVFFPAAILLCWLVFSRRHREILRAVSLPGILLFLAIALPWVVLVQRENPDFLWFFFVHEQFLRYTTKIHRRVEPFWFFLPVVIGGFVPWIAFLRRVVLAARGAGAKFLPREEMTFLLSWILFIFLFFSFSGSKLPTYVTPIFPPLAVLFGRGLDMWAEREDGAVRCRSPLALAALIAAAILWLPQLSRHPVDASAWTRAASLPVILILLWGSIPLFLRRLGAERVVLLSFLVLALFLTSLNRPAGAYIGSYKSAKGLAEAISASIRPGDVVAQYGVYRQGVPFYTKRRCVLVEEVGELEFGATRAKDRADYFPGSADFQRLWESGTRVFCVFNRHAMPLIREKFPSHRLLYRSDAGILIVNHP
ncbi:MAG: glycosyltransferase family 39 protein [Deltaproteobacteria bacterium]|nr:glycosyltransferase family 39 protein [Deltaproteobacteria bacterium]